jgi:hypothetical protein
LSTTIDNALRCCCAVNLIVGTFSVGRVKLLRCQRVLPADRPHDGLLERIVLVHAFAPHDLGRAIEQALLAVAGEPLDIEIARLEHRIDAIDMALLRSVGARRVAAEGNVFRFARLAARRRLA